MFGLFKKIFIGLLTGLVYGSNHTTCVSSSNEKCIIQPTLIKLHPNEYSQKFQYYPFAVKWDRCVWSCNPLNPIQDVGAKSPSPTSFSSTISANVRINAQNNLSLSFNPIATLV